MSSILIAIMLSLPIKAYYPSPDVASPSDYPTRELDSPEDATSLYSWLTVDWMRPLLSLAKKQTLEDSDVWQLSPFFRHYIIYPVFKNLPQGKLFRKIYRFTAFDFLITSCCSIVVAVLSFAGPYFLKRILEALSSDSPELRNSAYNLALLSFVLNVLKAEVDLFRTWHSRRSYERVRGALVTLIFDKATRKKDTSGSLGHRKMDKDEQDVQGADSGRILNMMNGDAYSVAQWFWEVCQSASLTRIWPLTSTQISTIIKAPLDLIIAISFLYA
jgi:ABC-type multidrug transport system fused ATPase/permease subunit